MIRKNSKYPIIYLYSEDCTPKKFVDIAKKMFDKVIPFRDITSNKKYKSYYERFNTLKTANYIHAYKLKEFDKVAIIESDLVIKSNHIDSIFNLECPSAYIYWNNVEKVTKQR